MLFNISTGDDRDGNAPPVEPEDGQTITEAQASVIRELIEQAALSNDVFCKRWQIDAVTDVPMSKFNEVVQSLRVRIKALKEKANEEKNNG